MATAEMCFPEVFTDPHLNPKLEWRSFKTRPDPTFRTAFNNWCEYTGNIMILDVDSELLTYEEFQKIITETRKTSSQWFKLTGCGVRVANGWTSYIKDSHTYWNTVPITLIEFSSRISSSSPWPSLWSSALEPFQY